MSQASRLRVAVAGFQLESATFVQELTTLEQFKYVQAEGEAILDQHRGANTPIGGFIERCESEGIEIIPIIYSTVGAAGPATDEAYDFYLQRIISGLRAAASLDGVLLDLHGAMTTPTILDADANMLEEVRRAVGKAVPIMVALDYHANLDERTIRAADAVFGYHYSPHTDMAATGVRAADCLIRTLSGEITPVWAIAKPGVMVPSIFSATGLDPLASIVNASIEAARDAKPYMDVSVFAGFSYADVPNCGFSVVVVTDGDQHRAKEIAAKFSDEIWRRREALYHRELVLSVDEGIRRAKEISANASRPVVLLEHADRMRDSTYLLRAALESRLSRTAVPYLWDPKAAAAASSAGVGASVSIDVGGHSSDRAGGPVRIDGRVVHAGPKKYRATGPYGAGSLIDLGLTAVVDTGEIVLSLISMPFTAIDEDCFTQFGMQAQDFDFIVLRSKTHFRAAYEQISAAILIVDTPDWGPADLTSLPYTRIPRSRTFPFCRS